MFTLQNILLFVSLGLGLSYFYLIYIRSKPREVAPLVVKPSVVLCPSLERRDKLWISALSLVYALISFIHFADFRQYQNPWHGSTPGDQLVLTLPAPTAISEFYYSTAYIKGKYTISAFSATGESIPVQDASSKLGYSPFFRWNKIDFDKHTPLAKVILHIDQGPVDITQFAIIDAAGQIFSNYRIAGSTNQDIVLNDFISPAIPEHLDNNWPSSSVFDEIYYATSAYQYLHGLPPDVWVHPQLGIYLIILGIIVFGMSPFGWRIMPDIASILLVPIIYIFAKRLFGERKVAIAASILIMCEFMHFTIGRTASLEPFTTLFLTLEYYFLFVYLQSRLTGVDFASTLPALVLAALSFAFAACCKWTALYSAPAILICLIYTELYRNKPSLKQFWLLFANLAVLFILLPGIVYIIMYIPYGMINHTDNLLQLVYQTQQGIMDFNLHGLVNATHPYASKWWSWPLDRMPLSVYYWQDAKGYMSTSIALIGNPALYWLTWATILILAYTWLRERTNYVAGFLFLAIVAQYFPYALVARISFIYYFYSVTPFLVLGVAYVLKEFCLSENKFYTYLVYIYLALNIILFGLFFPALSGVEVPRSYTTGVLWWMSGWNF